MRDCFKTFSTKRDLDPLNTIIQPSRRDGVFLSGAKDRLGFISCVRQKQNQETKQKDEVGKRKSWGTCDFVEDQR